MTLEEAQERILELTEENQNLTQERDSLSQDNERLRTDNENLHTLNQKYFNKLIAQEDDTENKKKDPEGEEVPSCEEFAKTLTII